MRYRLAFVTGSLIVLAIFSAQASGQAFTTLFSFDGSDGGVPKGSLILSGSTLYGMTYEGGTYNDGTIFSIPVGGGTPTMLFSFDGTNGANPYGSLMLSGSTLYGMTYEGGTYNNGTIFSIPVGGGTPTMLFNFDGTHGSQPYGGLLLSGSTLYGMTSAGGFNNNDDGTIFSIPVGGGTPTTLFQFDGTHGENPLGSLTLSADGSTLYGTTEHGGTNRFGTVFSIPVGGGTPTVLYSFGSEPYGGAYPDSSLILSGSTLYGATLGGGTQQDGDGMIFSIPVGGGTPTLLFAFDGSDGEQPGGSLILNGSILYGVTWLGGANDDGTVFSIPVGGGTATTLFNFDGTHGSNPGLGLILSGSTLYGTTGSGGTNGDGTVFALTVPEPSIITLLLASAACLLGFAWRRRKRNS